MASNDQKRDNDGSTWDKTGRGVGAYLRHVISPWAWGGVVKTWNDTKINTENDTLVRNGYMLA